MKVHLISYANHRFRRHQTSCLFSAGLFYEWESIRKYSETDIDCNFAENHKCILEHTRGAGYWLWKPYFILKRLNEIEDNEWLFYVDSGSVFVRSPKKLFDDALNNPNQSVFGFGLPLIEKQWTKDEAFDFVNDKKAVLRETNQVMASFILIKKTKDSLRFAEEYLKLCCQEDLLTDSISGPQSADFIEHRHDQSLFSLLYKKYNFSVYKDPTQLGLFPSGYSGERFCEYELGKLYKLNNGRSFRINKYAGSYKYILHHSRTESWLRSIVKYFIKLVLLRVFNVRTIVR